MLTNYYINLEGTSIISERESNIHGLPYQEFKMVTLTQEPYIAGRAENPHYEAHAKDNSDNIYLLIFEIDDIYAEDETEICNFNYGIYYKI